MGRGGKLAGGLWRVGLYIRLSRDDGREESLSVQNQRKILLVTWSMNSKASGSWPGSMWMMA